jgi:hypothetical protein
VERQEEIGVGGDAGRKEWIPDQVRNDEKKSDWIWDEGGNDQEKEEIDQEWKIATRFKTG